MWRNMRCGEIYFEMWRYIRCREILGVKQFEMWRFFRYKEKHNSHCFAVRSVLLPCPLMVEQNTNGRPISACSKDLKFLFI